MATDFDIEKLIDGVRARPPLWNQVDPRYRNSDFTNGLWNAIVVEMGGNLTVAELKQKWHNLRDCFRREVRIAQAGKKKRRWIYYNQMQFLLTPEYLNRKDKSRNSKASFAQQLISQDETMFPIKMEPPDEMIQYDFNNPDSNNSEFIETGNINCDDLLETTQNESETDNDESDIPTFAEAGEHSKYCKVQIADESSKTRMKSAGSSKGRFRDTTDNDDYHFAMSIIPHMRKVPAHRKLKMRIKISEIIAEESNYSETPS